MRKVLACFLALLMLCTVAFAESVTANLLPESYFLADIQRAYPDWSVRISTRYGSGRYEGEIAQHAEISLYRITDEAIELLELTALVNPIREGDDVPWSAHALIPVEIAPGAADTLRAMTAKEIFDYGVGAAFTDAARNLLVPSLRAADETVTQLMSCSKFLFCITENSAGQSILRLAQWDGSGYTNVTATQPQPRLSFNTSHSYNDRMELWVKGDEVNLAYDAADGVWRFSSFYIGDVDFFVWQNRVIEGRMEGEYQTNDDEHYGRCTLPTTLTEVDFAAFPRTFAEVLASMDYTGVACTAHDDTPLYAAPDGDVLAYCYTRVPMTIISESGDWREVQLGGETNGLRCWVRAADLAFGADTENVVCTFPTHRAVDRVQEAVSFGGKALALEDGTAWWIIGTLPSGDYLMMYAGDEEIFVGTAPASAFSAVGEAEDDEDDDW